MGPGETSSIADALVKIGWSPLLFIWAWTQGEPAVIAGGALAAQGWWPWYAFCAIAAVPSALGHEIYYFLGRRYGTRLLERLPSPWQGAITRSQSLITAHDTVVLLMMRFAYGIRGPLPVVCGAAKVPAVKFLVYNFGTAIVWAGVFTLIGYAFGSAATTLFQEFSRDTSWFLFSSLAFGLLVHVLGKILIRRASSRLFHG